MWFLNVGNLGNPKEETRLLDKNKVAKSNSLTAGGSGNMQYHVASVAITIFTKFSSAQSTFVRLI